jgi:hypothetical protein
MYKNIIAIGDSFLEGAELLNPLKQCVPHLLADHYKVDCYNLAKSGVGILAVVQQLLDAELSGLLTQDSLVIYCVPPAGRIDFPGQVESDNLTFDYYYHAKIIDGTFDLPVADDVKDSASYKKVKNLYTSTLGTDWIKFGEQLQLAGLCTLIQLLSKYSHVGICGHPQYYIDVTVRKSAMAALTTLAPLFIDEGFTGWAKKNQYSILPYGHPGSDAHAKLLELLIRINTIK